MNITNWFKNLKKSIELAFLKPFKFKDILDWYDHSIKKHINIELNVQQRAILAAYYGLDLDLDQEEILYDWIKEGKAKVKGIKPYEDLVVEAGRRSGKDFLLNLICLYEFERLCWDSYLAPSNSVNKILIASNNLSSSSNMLRYLASKSPYTQKLLQLGGTLSERKLEYGGTYIKLANYHHYTMEHPKGAYLVAFNECAIPDNTIGLWSKCKTSKRIAFSSAFRKDDAIESLFNSCEDADDAAGFKLASWDLLPELVKRDGVVTNNFYEGSPKLAATIYEGIR